MAQPPDLAARPFNLMVERLMPVSPTVLYHAWTQGFGLWFADPATVPMRPEVDAPFYFVTVHNADHHPHYGRFLRLVPDQLVELTWVTGAGGTEGAEMVVTVEFIPDADSTRVHLTHAGFPNAASRDAHAFAWPLVLEQQEQRLTATR